MRVSKKMNIKLWPASPILPKMRHASWLEIQQDAILPL